MLELTGFLGLTRISFFLLPQIPRYCFVGGKSHRCFCAWVARADSTLLLGSHGSHFLGSHGSHRSHSIAVWVGNLTDASVGVGSDGGTLLSLSRTYLLDPSDKSDLSDKSDGLDIFKNNP